MKKIRDMRKRWNKERKPRRCKEEPKRKKRFNEEQEDYELADQKEE
jgi:hypothetical protein